MYRYFGRAKELPGVKELFASKKKDEEEENLAASYYKKFLNHGPPYYGDLDEASGELLEYEMQAEERGMIDVSSQSFHRALRDNWCIDWAEAYTNLRVSLGLDTDEPIPRLQRQGTHVVGSSTPESADDTTQPKRKHPPDGDTEMTNGEASSTLEEASKRPKKDGSTSSTQPATGPNVNEDSPAVAHARAAAAYIPFLTPEMLMPPKMPTAEEMEKVLLDLRKRALVEEYFGNEGP